MKHAKQIFIQDLKNIRRVPLVGILLIALAVLPALYAWFNLGAAWDPYDNTGGVSVAVVNDDEGTEYNGEELHIGLEIEQSLKDNEDLNWIFMERSEAEKQVRSGDVYASVYLDPDFSEATVEVLEEGDTNVAVRYEVNEKINAIAPTMTESGATTITQQINDSFVEALSSALLEEFDRLGLRLEDEMPAFRSLVDKVYEIEEALPELNRLADILIAADDDWDEIEEAAERFLELEQYQPEIEQAFTRMYDLEQRVPELYAVRDTTRDIQEVLPQFEEGIRTMQQVENRFPEAEEEIARLSAVLADAEGLIDGGESLLSEVESEVAGAEQSLSGLQNRTNAVEQSAGEALGAGSQAVQVPQELLIQLSQRSETASSTLDEAVELIEAAQSWLDSDVVSAGEAASYAEDAAALLVRVEEAGEWTDGMLTEAGEIAEALGEAELPEIDIDPSLSGEALTERFDEIETVLEELESFLARAEEINIDISLEQLSEEVETSLEEFRERRASLPDEETVNDAVSMWQEAGELAEMPSFLLEDLTEAIEQGNRAEIQRRTEAVIPVLVDTADKLEQLDGSETDELRSEVQEAHGSAEHLVDVLDETELPSVEVDLSLPEGTLTENLHEMEAGLQELDSIASEASDRLDSETWSTLLEGVSEDVAAELLLALSEREETSGEKLEEAVQWAEAAESWLASDPVSAGKAAGYAGEAADLLTRVQGTGEWTKETVEEAEQIAEQLENAEFPRITIEPSVFGEAVPERLDALEKALKDVNSFLAEAGEETDNPAVSSLLAGFADEVVSSLEQFQDRRDTMDEIAAENVEEAAASWEEQAGELEKIPAVLFEDISEAVEGGSPVEMQNRAGALVSVLENSVTRAERLEETNTEQLGRIQDALRTAERLTETLEQTEPPVKEGEMILGGTFTDSGKVLLPELEAVAGGAEQTLSDLGERTSVIGDRAAEAGGTASRAVQLPQELLLSLSEKGEASSEALQEAVKLIEEAEAWFASDPVSAGEAAAYGEQAAALLVRVQEAGEWTEKTISEAERIAGKLAEAETPALDIDPSLSGETLTERLDEIEETMASLSILLTRAADAESLSINERLAGLASASDASLTQFREARAAVPDEESLGEAVDETVAAWRDQAGALAGIPADRLENVTEAVESGSAAEIQQRVEAAVPVLEQAAEILEQLDTAGVEDLNDRMQEALQAAERIQDAGENAAVQAEQERERLEEIQQFLEEEAPALLDTAFSGIRETLDQDERFREAERYLLLASDSLSAADDGLNTAHSAVDTAAPEFPGLAARWSGAVGTASEAYPYLEETVIGFEAFLTENMPVFEEQLDRMIQFSEEDWPQIEENYEDAASFIEDTMPVAEETVSKAAKLAREDFPQAEEAVRDAADQLRSLEEEETLQGMIDILRNDLYDQAEMLANPVSMEEESLFPIPNYGSANAPFYTALSLWIGALLLVNLVSTALHGEDRRPEYTERDVYFGRMGIFLMTAVLQGIVVSLGNLFILGMYSAHSILFTVFAVLIALVFMLIVYTLASIFGNIGKALAIVLLVLQLSGGGGTFPIEVTPPFFQAVHPFLPFTYAIDLLREAVGGIVWSTVGMSAAVLAGVAVLTILLGVILKPKLAERINQTTEKSKSSRLID
jgi:putative membrane protein